MLHRPLIMLALAAITAAGCGYRPNPIPLRASVDDLTPLQGEWTGSYTSSETGRTGSISFTLEAGADIAYGEVVMTPGPRTAPITRTIDAASQGRDAIYGVPEVLTIAFVRVDHDRVSGKLDAYRDPTCGCMVVTTFTGQLRSTTVLEGTYVTAATELLSPQTGTWRVTRVRR